MTLFNFKKSLKNLPNKYGLSQVVPLLKEIIIE